MLMQQIFDPREQRQHDHRQHAGDQGRFPGPETASNPEPGGEPDRGGSGQAADVLADIVDNHARTEDDRSIPLHKSRRLAACISANDLNALHGSGSILAESAKRCEVKLAKEPTLSCCARYRNVIPDEPKESRTSVLAIPTD